VENKYNKCIPEKPMGEGRKQKGNQYLGKNKNGNVMY
jgi:hypothetical protein